jgi:hypothetical protein
VAQLPDIADPAGQSSLHPDILHENYDEWFKREAITPIQNEIGKFPLNSWCETFWARSKNRNAALQNTLNDSEGTHDVFASSQPDPFSDGRMNGGSSWCGNACVRPRRR